MTLSAGRQRAALADLSEWDENPRRISDDAIAALRRSLEAEPELLEARPLIALPDGTVIAGNMRLRALRDMGAEEATVHVVDADRNRAREIALRDNNQFGEWEEDSLARMIAGLVVEGSDPMGMGFDSADVDRLLGSLGPDPEVDPDAVPLVPGEPVTTPGALIRLGEHRLVCGDSTDRDVVADACACEPAAMLWTDPPYGVDYVGKTGDALTIDNDDLGAADFDRLLIDSLRAALDASAPGAPAYVCHAASATVVFHAAFTEAGWRYAQTLQWVKDRAVMGRQDHNWQHEPILYGWKPGAAHRWYGRYDKTTLYDDEQAVEYMAIEDLQAEVIRLREASVSDVVREARPSRSADHPTMKPVALIETQLKNSSQRGDLVLDPFGGSGSTLIACERLGRRCAMVELDPGYCDVIVARWEKLTGKTAQR